MPKVTTPDGLTPKEALFILYYCGEAAANGARAAEMAGYTAKDSKGFSEIGRRLLRKSGVRDRVRELTDGKLKKLGATVEETIAAARAMTVGDAYEIIEVDNDRAVSLRQKPKKLHRRAIQEISYMEAPGEYGPMRSVKVRMHQKGAGVAQLFKYFDLAGRGRANGDGDTSALDEAILKALRETKDDKSESGETPAKVTVPI